jgi:hypothetical protein
MGSIEPMAAHIQYVYVSSYIMRIKYVQIDEKKFILYEYPHSPPPPPLYTISSNPQHLAAHHDSTI